MRLAGPNDASDLNYVLNHPANGAGGLDLSPILANPLNICLLDLRGATIFAWRGPGIYEVHIAYLARGRRALEMGRESIAYITDKVGPRMIWATPPETNKACRWFCRQMGFKSLGPIEMPPLGACELFKLEI